uniref:Uncharacterized protein n=1 Tax=Oryza sativa subsp. japonica TaxID=39947 RepID=Q69MY3_ORYSJ|nr:hypothetical protein [Oryza sativa Japonica Group]
MKSRFPFVSSSPCQLSRSRRIRSRSRIALAPHLLVVTAAAACPLPPLPRRAVACSPLSPLPRPRHWRRFLLLVPALHLQPPATASSS